MKLALSMLCENPRRPTGLSTLFHEFVAHALTVRPDVRWVLFAGRDQPWRIHDDRVDVVRRFPSNEHRGIRLLADHLLVAPEARRRGADALLTVGFAPIRTAGMPLVMHVFSVHHHRRGGAVNAYRRAAVRRGLRTAALVITNSQWAARELDAEPKRLLVSHEGVQLDRFRPEGPRGFAGGPQEYVLWSSNFYQYKRADRALAAYAALPVEFRRRFPLVLAGGDWEGGRVRAEAVAHRLGIASDTRFLGWVDDDALPALYRGARCHVLSTEEETFGRSVVEAMASGCPSLLQDLPVLREVAGSAAAFTDFDDATTSAEAWRRLCRDDNIHDEARVRGLNRAADFRFDRLAAERIDAIAAALKAQQ